MTSLVVVVVCSVGFFALAVGARAYGAWRMRSHTRRLGTLVLDVLESSGLPYWIDYGSALAAYRGEKIIEFDDVDLATTVEHFDEMRALLRARLGDVIDLPASGESMCMKLRGRGLWLQNTSLDIYRYAEKEGLLVRVDDRDGALARNDRLPVPVRLVLPTQRVEWLGRTVSAPGRARTYLELRYGCIDRDAVYDPRERQWVPRRSAWHALACWASLWYARRRDVVHAIRKNLRRLY